MTEARDHSTEDRKAVVDRLDDPFLRRFVTLTLHVRAYAMFYLASAALLGVLAFGPRPGGHTNASDAQAAAAAGTLAQGGGAAAGRGGTAAGGRVGAGVDPASSLAGPVVVGAAGWALADPAGAEVATGTEAGALPRVSEPTATASTPTAPTPPPAPTGDPTGEPGEVAACTIQPPAPAPSVTPAKELSGAQDTAEAVADQEVPVDGGSTVGTAIDTAGCPGGTTAQSATVSLAPADVVTMGRRLAI